MPEWLAEALRDSGSALTWQSTALRLVVATVTGVAIAWIYRRTVRRTALNVDALSTALVLLSVLVAMTSMVIDNNVARAFSLVGALAIVRFRTDVEDTRDTAFVIFAVVAGMAAGVGNWVLCAIGVPMIGLVAIACAMVTRRAPEASSETGPEQPLLIRLGTAEDPKLGIEPVLNRHLGSTRLVKTATARQGAALELTWTVRLREGGDPVALVRELNAVKGVQHVELGEA